MAKQLPLVSFITINYVQLADTIELLESFEKVTYPNIEIIVVDNASPSGRPTAEIKSRFSHVKFIQSEKNLGFAGGNNVGIRVARGEYLFLINNDTLLYPDFLEPIVEFMQTHPDVGMASPKVLYPDRQTIQFAGAIGVSPFTGRGKCLGAFEKDEGQYDRCYQTDLGHGAALIIPKAVVDKVGLMPELYFLYYEEHDWCERVKQAGYKMYFIGTSKVIHKESVTTGRGSPFRLYYMTRNRLIFMRRNFTGLPYLVGMLFFIFISLPKNTLVHLYNREWTYLKYFYKGVFWNLTHPKLNQLHEINSIS